MLAVGALVKTDEQEVINFLLTTEIIPLCLRIMESGSELSKTVCNTFQTGPFKPGIPTFINTLFSHFCLSAPQF